MIKDKIMSITVNNLDEIEVKKILKTCPKIIQQYVKALTDSIERKDALANRAIAKLKLFNGIENIEEYATFCVESDRQGFPLLKYNDWVNEFKL